MNLALHRTFAKTKFNKNRQSTPFNTSPLTPKFLHNIDTYHTNNSKNLYRNYKSHIIFNVQRNQERYNAIHPLLATIRVYRY